MPALAMGNRIVLVPSQSQPPRRHRFLSGARYIDVPDGAFNIITGARDELAKTMD